MPKKKRKKKLNKKKKKFFIILSCYVATFLITSLVTVSTLAWFGGSTWQDEVVYMGGPVYIYFSDDTTTNITSGKGELVSHLPTGWERLYPGMNINFEAQAVFVGHTFDNTTTEGDLWQQYTTGGVLRARIKLEVFDPNTGGNSEVAQEIYDWIWPQLQSEAILHPGINGSWVFDQLNFTTAEQNWFYYVAPNQTDVEDYTKLILQEVGGHPYNEAVDFLNGAVIQLPGMELTNAHADCDLTFTIVFEAVQAYFPYEMEDIGTPYQGDTTGRSPVVTIDDVGLGKPLNLENSRKIFNEAAISTFPEVESSPEPSPEETESTPEI